MMEDGKFPMNLMEAELKLDPIAACNDGIQQHLRQGPRASSCATRAAHDAIPTPRSATATKSIVGTMGDPLTGNMVCAGASQRRARRLQRR